MIQTYNDNNIEVMNRLSYENVEVDLVYGDCIYESTDFDWVFSSYQLIKPNGIFMVQTDYHTVANYKALLDSVYGKENFLNWIIYKNEWGGTSKRFFPRKHDDILIYSKGKDYKFYPDRIQIPKKTAGTAFDKKGTGLKTPCDVFDDLGNFSTVSKERIRYGEKGFQYQKPLKLMDRLLFPFTDVEETVLDPFMGSGTTAIWCLRNNRSFIGVEIDPGVYALAVERINND